MQGLVSSPNDEMVELNDEAQLVEAEPVESLDGEPEATGLGDVEGAGGANGDPLGDDMEVLGDSDDERLGV